MSIISEYLNYTNGTEPPKQYHRWSFLACVGACLGRRVYIQHGHSKIYPNMYVLLIGAPGTRKSSAIDAAKKLLSAGGYSNFSFDKSTKQKFLLDLQEMATPKNAKGEMDMEAILDVDCTGPDVTECYICADEFADFLGTGNLDFITLLTTLWDNKPKYEDRLKNSKSVKIEQPTINILGGLTPVSFASSIPQEASGNGFLSRAILVYGEPGNNRITWPTPPNEEDKAMFAELFRKLADLEGEVQITPNAYRAVDEIYQQWEDMTDVRLQYYCSRRLSHLLKVAIVIAALNCIEKDTEVPELDEEVIWEANTILSYTEEYMGNALGELGKSRNSEAAQKIMEKLANAKGPVEYDELWISVSQDLEKQRHLMEILQNLVAAKKITSKRTEINGVTSLSFTMSERRSRSNRPYVNYAKYIAEYIDTHEKLHIKS